MANPSGAKFAGKLQFARHLITSRRVVVISRWISRRSNQFPSPERNEIEFTLKNFSSQAAMFVVSLSFFGQILASKKGKEIFTWYYIIDKNVAKAWSRRWRWDREGGEEEEGNLLGWKALTWIFGNLMWFKWDDNERYTRRWRWPS